MWHRKVNCTQNPKGIFLLQSLKIWLTGVSEHTLLSPHCCGRIYFLAPSRAHFAVSGLLTLFSSSKRTAGADNKAFFLVEMSWYWASVGLGFDVGEAALYLQILSGKDKKKTHI